MPAVSNILVAAAAALLIWGGLGLSVGRLIVPGRGLAMAIAPALGWALFNAAAQPLLLFLPFDRLVLALCCAAALVVALLLARLPAVAAPARPGVPWWGYLAAAILALAPAMALMPKFVDGGIWLADPIYDHSKVSMIDDIARLGLPAGNPYFGDAGHPSSLGYYYLWHFGAAMIVRLLGVSGWEADIGLTWVTAFASLSLMMGLAAWFSGRRLAVLWVVLLCLSLTARPILALLLGDELFGRVISVDTNLEGWLSQATWVPQHLASADCVTLAVYLLPLLGRRPSRLMVPVIGLLAAAGFESSTWIGGFVLAFAAPAIGLWLWRTAPRDQRLRFVIASGLAAVLALVLAASFLRDEYLGAEARALGTPIALKPYEVLGPFLPEGLRRSVDLPAFWLIFLVLEFPAIVATGTLVLWQTLRSASFPLELRRSAGGLALLALTGLTICWLLASIIANNDLGWRAVLPSLMVLTVFAAAGLADWLARRAWGAVAGAAILYLLGLPDGVAFLRQNATGIASPSAPALAASPDLWAAVRKAAGPAERVGNNPLFLAGTLTWPVNISWALFADRRSCFPGTALAEAYVAVPRAEIDGLEALFERVFAGAGSDEDISALARRYQCKVIVVTPADGVWAQDGFGRSADYRLFDERPGWWRIYRANDQADRTRSKNGSDPIGTSD